MDRRLLEYYNRELQHLREMGGEFAKEFPKIAGRLSLDALECKDPYVERMLDGFAFLAARVHLKLDAEFPRFTQSMLETVYPHYLAPVPSMAMVHFQPDLSESDLAGGFNIPVGKISSIGANTPWFKGISSAIRQRSVYMTAAVTMASLAFRLVGCTGADPVKSIRAVSSLICTMTRILAPSSR